MLELMQVDKKAVAGRARYVLLSAIGHAVLRDDIDERTVRDVIAASTAPTRSAAAQ
jgi:3-dehydroquinate synthetase